MISLIGPINSLGYGVATTNILKSLSRLSEVALWPIGQAQIFSEEDHAVIVEAIENTNRYDKYSPCIRIWHQNDLAQFAGKGKHIGFPIFELDNFSKIEKHHLSSVDELFVCSEWAKNIISNYVDVKTSVIPLGVDTSIFRPVTKNLNYGDTIFFNCGKWEVRKGHEELISAFINAFTPEDNVQLWLMCENPFNSDKEDQKWHSMFNTTKLYKHGRIKIIPRVRTHQEVYSIMSKADCGVFPSRAEGWNLEAIEMLACGKQLIITNYSAHTEFCNSNNSFLLPVQESELAYDDKWFFGQGSWGKLDHNHIDLMVEYMRQIHQQKQLGLLNINQAGVETANKFNWDNTARKILDVL